MNQRDNVKAYYQGKKYIPTDLRAKKTRALRRKLTKFEASRLTDKARKQKITFARRNYAIKA